MNALDIDKVLECVQLYTTPQVRCTKAMIAYYLRLPYSNSHNNPTDRAIRDAITELRKRGHPVCSETGKAGYWYSRDSVEVIIADYRSRIIDMSETVRALERGWQPERARQMELV
jgi:hypothetical protein